MHFTDFGYFQVDYVSSETSPQNPPLPFQDAYGADAAFSPPTGGFGDGYAVDVLPHEQPAAVGAFTASERDAWDAAPTEGQGQDRNST